MANDATRLLGLDGLAAVGVADSTDGPVVHLVTADERARHFPDCGTRARRSKGRRVTRPLDALLDELSNLPRVIGAPITVAWNAKEDLLDLLATARTRPDREQVRDRADAFSCGEIEHGGGALGA